MSDNTKLTPGTYVIVFIGTPTYESGAICQILDRDPHDNSYAVATLKEIGAFEGNVKKLLERCAKWVDRSNLEVISFERRQNLFTRLKNKLFSLFTFRKSIGQESKGKID